MYPVHVLILFHTLVHFSSAAGITCIRPETLGYDSTSVTDEQLTFEYSLSEFSGGVGWACSPGYVEAYPGTITTEQCPEDGTHYTVAGCFVETGESSGESPAKTCGNTDGAGTQWTLICSTGLTPKPPTTECVGKSKYCQASDCCTLNPSCNNVNGLEGTFAGCTLGITSLNEDLTNTCATAVCQVTDCCSACTTCCTPFQIPNSDHSATGSMLAAISGSVVVTCDTGYSGSGTAVCSSRDKNFYSSASTSWEERMTLTCTPIPCTQTQIANSNKAEINSIIGATGSIVDVICSVGFTIQGGVTREGSVTCRPGGAFSDLACNANSRCTLSDSTLCVGNTHLKDSFESIVCTSNTCSSSDCCETNPSCTEPDFSLCAGTTYHPKGSFFETVCISNTCSKLDCCETNPSCTETDFSLCAGATHLKDSFESIVCTSNTCSELDCCGTNPSCSEKDSWRCVGDKMSGGATSRLKDSIESVVCTSSTCSAKDCCREVDPIKISCVRPNTAGYDATGVKGEELEYEVGSSKHTFSGGSGWTCGQDFSGTVTSTACTKSTEMYSVSGCTPCSDIGCDCILGRVNDVCGVCAGPGIPDNYCDCDKTIAIPPGWSTLDCTNLLALTAGSGSSDSDKGSDKGSSSSSNGATSGNSGNSGSNTPFTPEETEERLSTLSNITDDLPPANTEEELEFNQYVRETVIIAIVKTIPPTNPNSTSSKIWHLMNSAASRPEELTLESSGDLAKQAKQSFEVAAREKRLVKRETIELAINVVTNVERSLLAGKKKAEMTSGTNINVQNIALDIVSSTDKISNVVASSLLSPSSGLDSVRFKTKSFDLVVEKKLSSSIPGSIVAMDGGIKFEMPTTKDFLLLTSSEDSSRRGEEKIELHSVLWPKNPFTSFEPDYKRNTSEWVDDSLHFPVASLRLRQVNVFGESNDVVVSHLVEPIVITFPYQISFNNVTKNKNKNKKIELVCVWWNEKIKGWSDHGCQLLAAAEGNMQAVQCQCNHLTSFAVRLKRVGQDNIQIWKSITNERFGEMFLNNPVALIFVLSVCTGSFALLIFGIWLQHYKRKQLKSRVKNLYKEYQDALEIDLMDDMLTKFAIDEGEGVLEIIVLTTTCSIKYFILFIKSYIYNY